MTTGEKMEINLKRPELEDRATINHYLSYANTRSCEMTFANIYLWSRHYHVGFAQVGDMLVFGYRDEEPAFTVPIGPGDLKTAVDALMAWFEEQGKPFMLYNVTREDFARLEALYPGQFEIEYDRDYADYVYETEKLAALSGRKISQQKESSESI